MKSLTHGGYDNDIEPVEPDAVELPRLAPSQSENAKRVVSGGDYLNELQSVGDSDHALPLP